MCIRDSIYSTPISLELTQEALPDLLTRASVASPNPEQILEVVANHYNLPVESLISKRRDKAIVLARQIAMYLIKDAGIVSLTDIGRLLGGRARSSVLHAHEKISKSLTADPRLAANVRVIREGLRILSS